MASHNNDFLHTLGRALRKKRELLGMSQEEIASKAELHRTYISDVERGTRNISLQTLMKLSIALRVSASGLVSEAEMLAETVDFSPSQQT